MEILGDLEPPWRAVSANFDLSRQASVRLGSPAHDDRAFETRAAIAVKRRLQPERPFHRSRGSRLGSGGERRTREIHYPDRHRLETGGLVLYPLEVADGYDLSVVQFKELVEMARQDAGRA